MSNTVERLKRVMSYTEIKVAKRLYEELDGKVNGCIVNGKISTKEGISKTLIINAIKLLEVTGILETRSMGMKGTYIRILDQEALQQVANF